jgi:hypothetical protein
VGHKERNESQRNYSQTRTNSSRQTAPQEPKRRETILKIGENLPNCIQRQKKFRENSQNRGDQVDKMSRKKLKNSRVIPKTDWVLRTTAPQRTDNKG